MVEPTLKQHCEAALTASKISTPQFPPMLLISHFALESGWGKSKIGNYNYFGMTAAARHTIQYWKDTTEFFTMAEYEYWKQFPDKIKFTSGKTNLIPEKGFTKFEFKCKRPFADFPSLADAYRDVVSTISCIYSPIKSPYKSCWKGFKDGTLSWVEFAKQYGKVYATAPNYGETLVQIANQANIKKIFKELGYKY